MPRPEIVQAGHELRRRRETVLEVIRRLGIRVVDEWTGIEPVDQRRVLVDAHVVCAPFAEVGAVADVVAASEMEGDEAVEGAFGAGGQHMSGGTGLEKCKVACDGGVDEG